jgi:hypothetical protein
LAVGCNAGLYKFFVNDRPLAVARDASSVNQECCLTKWVFQRQTVLVPIPVWDDTWLPTDKLAPALCGSVANRYYGQYHPRQPKIAVSIPFNRPIKPVYIVQFLALIDDIGNDK